MRIIWICLLLLLSNLLQAQLSEQAFNRPEAIFAPRVRWQWMNGNITKEGINLDLEAMAATGLSGGVLYNKTVGMPVGPIKFRSAEWTEMTVHALKQSDRLGLKWMLYLTPCHSILGGPWIAPENAIQKLVWCKTYVKGGESVVVQLPKPDVQLDYYKDIAVLAYPSLKGEDQPFNKLILASKIIDLTNFANSDGRLTWNVPNGNWTIVRFGHTVALKDQVVAADSCNGLDVDNLGRQGVQQYEEHFLKPFFEQTLPFHGRSFEGTAIDKVEVGHLQWTRAMTTEFLHRTGYDLKRYLLAFTGMHVNSIDETDRFFWDLHRVQTDMMEEYYYGGMRDILRKNGLNLFVDSFPMHDSTDLGDCPSILKAKMDLKFMARTKSSVCIDLVHQPLTRAQPGKLIGALDSQNTRNNTWFSKATGYFEYLHRCQYVLQSGQLVADAAYFMGEESKGQNEPKELLKGLTIDVLTRDALLQRTSVKNNRLVLSDGTSFRFLMLPNSLIMSLQVLRKLKNLLEDGLWISAAKPTTWTGVLSLKDQAEWRSIVEDMWDKLPDGVYRYGAGRLFINVPAATIYEEAGLKPDFSYASSNANSDIKYLHRRIGFDDVWFVQNNSPKSELALVSFRIIDRQPEWWNPQTGEIIPIDIFRQHDEYTLIPLSLQPFESGFVVFRKMIQEVVYDGLLKDGRPLLTANLDEFPTVKPTVTQSDSAVSNRDNTALPDFLTLKGNRFLRQKGRYTLLNPGVSHKKQLSLVLKSDLPVYDLSSDWVVCFPENEGAPEQFKLDTLTSLHTVKSFGVNCFSGTASWKRMVLLTQKDLIGNQLILDLGRVSVLADVYVNGKSAGMCWLPPFRLDVTKLLNVGENQLEIRVTNLWINRFISDDSLPTENKNVPLVESGLIGPVTLSVWKALKK